MTLRDLAPRSALVLTLLVTLACGGSGGSGGSSSPTAPNMTADDMAPTTDVVTADAMATYRVTFDATWSASSHPSNFPPNPHFSPLIGATHLENTRFWETGNTASNGIKNMAETGSTSPLDREIQRSIDNGRSEFMLSEFMLRASSSRSNCVVASESADRFAGNASSLVRKSDFTFGRVIAAAGVG